MRLAIVTDEISPDVAQAVTLARQWGIDRFELRVIGTARVPDIDAATEQQLKNMQQEGIVFTSLSPGNFKLPLTHPDLPLHCGQRLDQTIALAQRLGICKVIMFGIQREAADEQNPAAYQQVCDILGNTAQRLHSEGLLPLLENEPGWWPDTVMNTRCLLTDISGSHMMLNWDPGNFHTAGETGADLYGYETLRPWIAHLHMKDYRGDVGEPQFTGVPLGEGDMDWRGVLATLQQDGYQGEWMIETHCRPGPEMSKRCVEWLKAL